MSGATVSGHVDFEWRLQIIHTWEPDVYEYDLLWALMSIWIFHALGHKVYFEGPWIQEKFYGRLISRLEPWCNPFSSGVPNP